ncbi:MAG TPA: hypothetical protein VIE65_07100 [Methylobacter sp.]|jgi:hypothetical protein
MDLIDECTLLGASLLAAQKFEFALYGIVSHLSHLPEAQKEKRFRDLTPEKFLHGNIEDLKATLGQLETAFGQKLLISTEELKVFIRHRNLIAHNYWRLTKPDIKNSEKLDDPELFLRRFLESCDKWAAISRGLLYVLIEAAAQKENRLSEINFSEQQRIDVADYYAHAAKQSINEISSVGWVEHIETHRIGDWI